MKTIPALLLSPLLALSLSGATQNYFPYGGVPKTKPDIELSTAMKRVYDNYPATQPELNELFSNFKYTRLKGFDYHDDDGTVSRRDPSKVIRENGKYYIWYTHRKTATPPRGAAASTDTIPSADWDLAEIWYATSDDGFTWEEKGVAVPRPPKPQAGWRSVSTPDILKWKGKFYLYYQAFLEASGTQGDFCPVTASVADSPDGPWRPSEKVVLENGPANTWDQYAIHDPYPLVYRGRIYMYYKSEMGGTPKAPMQGLAIGDDPMGPFVKHPLNPVTNSGHETGYFPFKGGIAGLLGRHGNEHDTIQWSPDGVHFTVASSTALLPIGPGPYVPDAFTDTGDGRGITWGLSHFRPTGGRKYSYLVRFDCDLSLDVDDRSMKETDIFVSPDIYLQFPLSEKEQTKRKTDARKALGKE